MHLKKSIDLDPENNSAFRYLAVIIVIKITG